MNNKPNILFIASDQVRNSSDIIVPNENATLGNDGKKCNSYTCFIPENLNLEDLIRTSPPSIPSFHIDYLAYMVGLLIEIPIKNKDFDKEYVQINSQLVQRRVRNYRKYLDYLINCGVFIENKQYIVGIQSKGFKYTELYETKTKAYTLTKATLVKSLLDFKEINYPCIDAGNYSATLKKSNLESAKTDFGYITKWFNSKLIIDYDLADEFLINLKEKEKLNPVVQNPDRKYMYRQTTLLKFHMGRFSPIEDNTAGRLHSVFTQIKGVLRPFISYDGKKLIAIDIVNSQPYLSIALLNIIKFQENKLIKTIQNINPKLKTNTYPIMLVKKIINGLNSETTKLFIELVASGRFYEEFGLILKKEHIIDLNLDEKETRKKTKTITFSTLFSPNTAIGYSEEIKIFKKLFPDVFEVFKMIKVGNGHHNTLSILLQTFEANLVLHKACKIISEERPDIPIYTLHDSIITTEGNESYVYNVLKAVLTEAIGIAPELKVERWE